MTDTSLPANGAGHCVDGHSMAPDEVFCGKCGAPSATDFPEVATTDRVCANGHPWIDDGVFCGRCGASPRSDPQRTPEPHHAEPPASEATPVCPQGHLNRPENDFCALCGAQIRPVPAPSPTTTESHPLRRLALAVAAAAIVVGGILAIPKDDGESSAPAGKDTDEIAQEDPPVTEFGCPIEPIADYEDATSVDPTCTEGGAILRYCPTVDPDKLRVPAYDVRQGQGTLTRVYAVGDEYTDDGAASVTHHVPPAVGSAGRNLAVFTVITCPDGTSTEISSDEWSAFLDPA